MRTFTIYNLEAGKVLLQIKAARIYMEDGGIVLFYDSDSKLMGTTQITSSTVIYDAEEKSATILDIAKKSPAGVKVEWPEQDTCTNQQ